MAGSHRATPVPVRAGTSHGAQPSKAYRAAGATYSVVSDGSIPRGTSGNMLAILVTTAGAIMLYSAIANVAISVEIRDLVKGRNPRLDAGTGPNAVGGASETVDSTGAVPPDFFKGVPGVPGPNTTPAPGPAIAGNNITHTFETLVLRAIGAPLTQANYNFLTAWAGKEATAARNNPLATTYPVKGATAFNSFGSGGRMHVWNYGSEAIGALATAKTLLSGLYGDVVRALRSGNPSLTATYPGLSKWSGGAYSRVV